MERYWQRDALYEGYTMGYTMAALQLLVKFLTSSTSLKTGMGELLEASWNNDADELSVIHFWLIYGLGLGIVLWRGREGERRGRKEGEEVRRMRRERASGRGRAVWGEESSGRGRADAWEEARQITAKLTQFMFCPWSSFLGRLSIIIKINFLYNFQISTNISKSQSHAKNPLIISP